MREEVCKAKKDAIPKAINSKKSDKEANVGGYQRLQPNPIQEEDDWG